MTAASVLEDPVRIFKGIREFAEDDFLGKVPNLDTEDWSSSWCYVGVPDFRYTKDGKEVPFEKRMVFCVYVNPRLEIFHHRPDMADRFDLKCPTGYQTRFGGTIWTKSS